VQAIYLELDLQCRNVVAYVDAAPGVLHPSGQQTVHTCTMQRRTQAWLRKPMTPAQRLQLVSDLVDGDLETYSTRFDEFASGAFPVFRWAADAPIALKESLSYEYTPDLIKKLMAASSRSLELIARLFSRYSSSCIGADRTLQWEMPHVAQHSVPLTYVSYCSTLCGRVMETYVSTKHGAAAADMSSRQGELAATARSTGVWQCNGLNQRTVLH
jgi:hypothetical protein